MVASIVVYTLLACGAVALVRALFRKPEPHKVQMDFREVNNKDVLIAAALTNTSHRNG